MKTVKYKSEIYSLNSILSAVEAHREIADIFVSENAVEIKVTMKNCRYNEDRK